MPAVSTRYPGPEAREAYRRGARALYEGLLDNSTASLRDELTQWFERLDAWTEGDPPPPPPSSKAQPQLQPSDVAAQDMNSAAHPAKGSFAPAAATGEAAEFVFRVRLEIPTEGNKAAVTLEGQNGNDEPVEANTIIPDHNPARSEILQRLSAAQKLDIFVPPPS